MKKNKLAFFLNNKLAFFFLGMAVCLCWAAMPTSLNTGQFSSAGGVGSIKDGALVSNITSHSTLTVSDVDGAATLNVDAGNGNGEINIESTAAGVSIINFKEQSAVLWRFMADYQNGLFGLSNSTAGGYVFQINDSTSAALFSGVVKADEPSATNDLTTKFYVDSRLTNQNVLYVSKNGNDTTAQRNNFGRQFLTIGNAKTNSQPGDLIYVSPGTYNETDLLTNMVNYYFAPGAVVQYTGSSSKGIFDDWRQACTNTIFGAGKFINFSTFVATNGLFHVTNAQYPAVLMITNSQSYGVFQGESCIANQTNSVQPMVLCVADCKKYVIEMSDRLENLTVANTNMLFDGVPSTVYWEIGTMYVKSGSLLVTNTPGAGYNVWARNHWGTNVNTDLFIKAEEILGRECIQVGVESGDAEQYKVWINADTIYEIGSSGWDVPAIQFQQGGKLYVVANKISAEDKCVLDLKPGSGSFWLTAQKLTSVGGVPFVDMTGSKLKANVLQYEDLDGVTDAFRISGDGPAELNLVGGFLETTEDSDFGFFIMGGEFTNAITLQGFRFVHNGASEMFHGEENFPIFFTAKDTTLLSVNSEYVQEGFGFVEPFPLNIEGSASFSRPPNFTATSGSPYHSISNNVFVINGRASVAEPTETNNVPTKLYVDSLATNAVQTASPATGATVNMSTLGAADASLFLTPAGTIATLTVNLPADGDSSIGQIRRVLSTQTITTLTVTNTTIIHGWTHGTLLATNGVTFQKVAANTWFKIP